MERNDGHDVFEILRLGLHQQVLHPPALELEHADDVCTLKQIVRCFVVQRKRTGVHVNPLGAQQRQSPLDYRERAQAQHVHLQQADRLQRVHVVLRADVPVRSLVQGHELGHRPGCNHHAGGVNRGVTGHALQPLGNLPELLVFRVRSHQPFQFLILTQRIIERSIEWYQLGQPVDLAQRHVEHPPHVAHRGLGTHRAERHNLGDAILAVAPADVTDDFPAPAVGEVDVDVRQRYALRGQEALEDQPVAQRVNIGNSQRIEDQAADRRPPPRPDRNALAPGIVYDVLNDQEVAREIHPANHVQFVFQPVAERAGSRRRILGWRA